MHRRSGFSIMLRLIKELKPLIPVMMITITMGVLGFLVAIGIMTLGAVAISDILGVNMGITFKGALITMIIFGILRGVFRYAEQLSGHYIAFRILAILRDKVFTALRKLAPAKLEDKGKGNLISIITSDIELLEVFYAHTIAPIAIAIITSAIIAGILFNINPYFGMIALAFYVIIGFCIPFFSSIVGKDAGFQYRNMFGKTNSYLLDSLRGLKEVLMYNVGEKELEEINNMSYRLDEKMKVIKKHEGIIRALTDLIIMIAILLITVVGYNLYISRNITISGYVVGVVTLAASFGPVVALSNLSNNLLHTFACAERLFNILDEKPAVEEVSGDETLNNENIEYNEVNFAYEGREKILDNVNLSIKKGDKIAVLGKSGIGKSTLVKLLMRFWDVNSGEVLIGQKNIKNIATKELRRKQTLVSQETFLFNDTIEYNIKIGNANASREEVIKAAKKASIHEFIETLPKGYDTKVEELGGNLSSGEKQRIGLARAILHDAPILILDEPTSNLDTLNEGRILKAINESCEDKTIILISHRKSTTAICNKIYRIENKKLKPA